MSVCLIVIFNHRYDSNLEKLDKLYRNRFNNIYYLVPFYNGTREDVVPVYESSYQFQGYLAQSYDKIANKKYSHYLIIGDDLILNPALNEDNILDKFGMDNGDAFIESLTPLNKTYYWYRERFIDADRAFKQDGTSYKDEIPSKEEAQKLAQAYGFNDFSLNHLKYTKVPIKRLHAKIKDLIYRFTLPIRLDYPLVTGYSDFIILPNDIYKEFCRLSGTFAAMRLFVEISIPTAIMFTVSKDHLKTSTNVNLKTPKLWWITDTVKEFSKQCDYRIYSMTDYWPEEYAYLHPIKLSKWKE
ncbi:hypothetical protein [Clostridium sp. 001]|uniref:hypothetical protein n=1 Tax=Clostridium sp. 001 TaxID=1970093 RepID=UPI001C2C148D|nr:hypothetical protein [Clostridium sp. 001]QXE19777.1 hypothetical protein B5S50_13605 [Clostridium sp. 001]